MANKFQLKRTTVSGRTPNTSNASNTSFIDVGELAVNIPDKKLFTSNGSALIELGSNLSNLSVTNTLTINEVSANGSTGTAGQVLTSNGSVTYWSDVEVDTTGAFPYTKTLVANNDFGSLEDDFVDSFGISYNQTFDCNNANTFSVVDGEGLYPEVSNQFPFTRIFIANSDFGDLSGYTADSFGVPYNQNFDCMHASVFNVVEIDELDPDRYGSRDLGQVSVDATKNYDYGLLSQIIQGAKDIINFGASYGTPLNAG